MNTERDADKKQQWYDDLFIETEVTRERSAGPGRPKKRLCDELCRTSRNAKLDVMIQQLELFSEEEGDPKADLLQMLTERCKAKWTKPKTEVPLEEGCALIYNINLSINQYQKLRQTLLPYDVELPTRNDIDEYKKSLQPNLSESSALKCCCSLKDLAVQTTKALLNGCSEDLFSSDTNELHVLSKFGLDGSGSHKIRHQTADGTSGKMTNFIGAFWCPLVIEHNNQEIWRNPLPNSIVYARPVCLVREKETRDNLLTHFKPILDEAKLLENSFDIVVKNTEVQLKVKTEISMVDCKMVSLLQGDSGGFCHYCFVNRQNANDPLIIAQGFHIEKTLEQMEETWKEVEAGNISWSDPRRAGQCHEPITSTNMRYFAVLHQKLRSFDHCLKLMYHLVADYTRNWSDPTSGPLKRAKQEVIDHIWQKCSFLVDTPTSGGGNTNVGGTAERFFAEENRDAICQIIRKESDRTAFSKLLSMFNIMLSITQQCDVSKVVNYEKVQSLGTELMLFHKEAFPFAFLSPTVHQMCAHSHELFQMNNGKPIAMYSEQSGEAWNKHIRSFQSGAACRARQSSLLHNTRDIFSRMMIATHPAIVSKRLSLFCTNCKSYGHTIRGCPQKNVTVMSEEKTEILSYYI